MTKRDSQFAELPSPRTLRMELPDIDMSVAGLHSYTMPATPGPDSHPQASSSNKPSSNNPSQIPPLPLPNVTHHGRPRQRVGHSILFKVLENTLPTGELSKTILVEETDARGYTQPKSLEFFFNGIIEHLRDRWGYGLDYTRLCSQLANYWRSWFGAPTIGPVFKDYTEPVAWENSEQPPPPTTVTHNLIESDVQILVQVLQVAWFLNAFIELHKEGNAELVREIQRTRIGTIRDLRTDRLDHRALANLCVDLGIMANRLAQQQAASQAIESVERDDDSS